MGGKGKGRKEEEEGKRGMWAVYELLGRQGKPASCILFSFTGFRINYESRLVARGDTATKF